MAHGLERTERGTPGGIGEVVQSFWYLIENQITAKERKKVPLCNPWEFEGNENGVSVLFQKTFRKEMGELEKVLHSTPGVGDRGKKQSWERTKERNWDVTARTEKPRGGGAGEEPRPAGGEGWPHAWLAAAQKTLTQRSRLSLILPQDWGRGKRKGGASQKS